MSTAAPRAIVVVPTYNERENLPALVEALMAHPNVSVLVVDDNSPDGTASVAHELRGKYPARMRVLERTGPRGLGRPYSSSGLRLLRREPADLICQMDADFSHDPPSCPPDRRRVRLRRRDRIALHPGRDGRELAAAPPAAQPVRQHVRT
jgi:dolichol-phosphate mannosyltransferase